MKNTKELISGPEEEIKTQYTTPKRVKSSSESSGSKKMVKQITEESQKRASDRIKNARGKSSKDKNKKNGSS